MKKNSPTQEYGKPYTAKDYRQVGIGMTIVGIIVLIFGIAVYLNGFENQIVITKGGNEIHGSDPGNPLYFIIGMFGGFTSLVGVYLLIRGLDAQN